MIRLAQKPATVMFNGKQADEMINDKAEGFKWRQLQTGGILIVNRTNSDEIIITE